MLLTASTRRIIDHNTPLIRLPGSRSTYICIDWLIDWLVGQHLLLHFSWFLIDHNSSRGADNVCGGYVRDHWYRRVWCNTVAFYMWASAPYIADELRVIPLRLLHLASSSSSSSPLLQQLSCRFGYNGVRQTSRYAYHLRHLQRWPSRWLHLRSWVSFKPQGQHRKPDVLGQQLSLPRKY